MRLSDYYKLGSEELQKAPRPKLALPALAGIPLALGLTKGLGWGLASLGLAGGAFYLSRAGLASPPMEDIVVPPWVDPGPRPTGWLHTEGNKILYSDGRPFRGRGVNLGDTRDNTVCSYDQPHPEEVIRRIDHLVDVWHVNFIRLLLEQRSDSDRHNRVHWRGVLEDEQYFQDIVRIVKSVGERHPGVYVLVSLWQDPSLDPETGLPTPPRTNQIWDKLARAFGPLPYVLYGVANEPMGGLDGKLDALAWDRMNSVVATIRATEPPQGPHHIVVVQGTQLFARGAHYYMDHPITAGGGINIAYEVHIYNQAKDFSRILEPAKKIPLIIGEFGIIDEPGVGKMTYQDVQILLDEAEKLGIPYLAFAFFYLAGKTRGLTPDPMNLIQVPPQLRRQGLPHYCATNFDIQPTQWGKFMMKRFTAPWGA